MSKSGKGFFFDTTVEITFNGVKKRVSQEVADALAGTAKGAKTTKAKKAEKVESIDETPEAE